MKTFTKISLNVSYKCGRFLWAFIMNENFVIKKYRKIPERRFRIDPRCIEE